MMKFNFICNKITQKTLLYYERTFNMKNIVKKIAAMGAVMMMSSMAIGASAYSGSINLHYTSGAPSSDNTTKNSWTVYTSTPTQTMKITSFTRGNGSAYVNLFNPMGINSNVSSVTTKTKANVKTGVKITVSATLKNYGSGGYSAYGSIKG